MNARHALLAWLACASAALGGGIAMAAAVPGEIVTGPITAINGNMVNIQGHIYTIAAASAAYEVVTKFQPGQIVDVQLNGPAKASSSQAINITLHWGD
ncbi:MAG TPA: hypothetical protein VNH41_06150 [Steroidobacteraceae bacterium]|nr:hypothetical protein [Steroidobacteraceae bacterium]